jgi:subtilisin family serine protease
VLDADGSGYAGDVVEAIDWAIANRDRYRIKVLNLSLGGPVLQPSADDPVDRAVARAYAAGLVVVASAGNHGKDENGKEAFGLVTVPGNSPFAITVGALNTHQTVFRSDDTITTYSSRGPTLFDHLIKPDLVAPGNKIVGLLAPGSTLATQHPELVIDTVEGKRLQLSGTSMSAAVVSGAAALLEQRGVARPEGIRLLLQQSSSDVADANALEAGAGSLNVRAALGDLSGTVPKR